MFFLGLGLVFLIASSTEAQEFDKSWLRAKFDVLDQAINNGEGYSKSTNEEGTLAWAESYLLEAYLDMNEVTNDSRYLDIFATQAKRVAENTDKLRGIRDFQGRSRTGWSAKKYSIRKERMIHVVQTGMILYPMTRFAFIVREDTQLERYSELGSRLVSLAEEAVAELDGQWRSERTGEGSYWFNGNEPIKADLTAPMPFNGPLALGKVIILLHRLTGKEVYLNKAKAMALLFKRNLLPNEKNGYVWGYRPDLKKYSKVEDLNHGAIDVSFAVEAFNSGILFTREDLVKFSNTLLEARSGRTFSIYVNGISDAKDPLSYRDATGRWLDLSEVDCAVYNPVYEYLTSRVVDSKKQHPQVLLGIAKLAKYYDKCKSKGATITPR